MAHIWKNIRDILFNFSLIRGLFKIILWLAIGRERADPVFTPLTFVSLLRHIVRSSALAVLNPGSLRRRLPVVVMSTPVTGLLHLRHPPSRPLIEVPYGGNFDSTCFDIIAISFWAQEYISRQMTHSLRINFLAIFFYNLPFHGIQTLHRIQIGCPHKTSLTANNGSLYCSPDDTLTLDGQTWLTHHRL